MSPNDLPSDCLRSADDTARMLADLDIARLQREVERLQSMLNTPHLEPFASAVQSEAQHQIYRWGDEQDATKTAWDWFWTLGYLGGKAAHSVIARDYDKALHHTVTAAALLANWHRHLIEARDASR